MVANRVVNKGVVVVLWIVFLACSCAHTTSDSLPLRNMLDIVPFLPDSWQESAYAAEPAINIDASKAQDGYYRIWVFEENDLIGGFRISALRWDSVCAARLGYWRQRKQAGELRDEADTKYDYSSPAADQSSVFCNDTSLRSCVYIARYGNIVVVASLWAGRDSGVSLEQSPELFSLFDTHVCQLLDACAVDSNEQDSE